MKIDAVIFDVDGLMVDSENLWLNSMLKAGKELGINITKKFLLKLVGLRTDLYNKELKKQYGEDFDVAKFREVAQEHFDRVEDGGKMKVKKGVFEILNVLKKKRIPMAIASMSKLNVVKYRLQQVGIDLSYFDYITGGDMVENAKPDPEIYIKSSQALGVNKENIIAFEDSPAGVESAFKAGIKVIHIPDMKKPSDQTKEYSYKILKNLKKAMKLFE